MRKNKRPELSQVVEDIYDAALDSARWKDTIAKIAEYVGGQAGGLALKDCQSKDLNVFYDVGFDQECIEVYLGTYSKFDPLATAPLFDLRQVASVPDLMPYDEYLNGRFYREWAQPQGWLDSANAIIERSGTSSTLLRIVTSKNTGLVDDNMRRRMAHVVPHVRRATLVGKAMDLKHAEAAMLAETLDGLSAGLFRMPKPELSTPMTLRAISSKRAISCVRSTAASWPGMPRSIRLCGTYSPSPATAILHSATEASR